MNLCMKIGHKHTYKVRINNVCKAVVTNMATVRNTEVISDKDGVIITCF
jgi:hypothetical protein